MPTRTTPILTLATLCAVSVALGLVLLAAADRDTSERNTPRANSTRSPSFAGAQLTHDYPRLRRKIAQNRADLADMRRAMTDREIGSLTNSVHALYAMQWHRGALKLLEGMWSLDEAQYPELSWDLIRRAPVRIALANSLNRLRTDDTEEYVEYIRAHRYDDHEFHRAQVAVALGINSNRADLAYLQEMSDGDNHYVAQSAITGLSLFGRESARDILIDLEPAYRGTPRGNFIRETLRQAYDWPPTARQSQ